MKLFLNAAFNEEGQNGKPFIGFLIGIGTCVSNKKTFGDWVWGLVAYSGRKSGGFLQNLTLLNSLTMSPEGQLIGFKKDSIQGAKFDIQIGSKKFPCRVIEIQDKLLTIKESDLKKLSPTPVVPMPNAPNDSAEMQDWLKIWLNQIVGEFGQ